MEYRIKLLKDPDHTLVEILNNPDVGIVKSGIVENFNDLIERLNKIKHYLMKNPDKETKIEITMKSIL